jgi:putative endonuclease
MKNTRDMRRSLGDFGETAAAAYLGRHGYAILERKWRCRTGEIDLVAHRDDQVIFVEVRTRHVGAYGSPEESVTPAKQARLVALAYAYLEAREMGDTADWRIDVIAIEIDGSGRIVRFNHIPAAIEARDSDFQA